MHSEQALVIDRLDDCESGVGGHCYNDLKWDARWRSSTHLLLLLEFFAAGLDGYSHTDFGSLLEGEVNIYITRSGEDHNIPLHDPFQQQRSTALVALRASRASSSTSQRSRLGL